MEVLFNTIAGVGLLYYETPGYSQSNEGELITKLVSDAIFLGLGNYLLSSLADPKNGFSNSLATPLKVAYYPVSSAFLYSAYSNMMYNNNYVRSFSLTSPITLGEIYINSKLYQFEKKEELKKVQTAVPNAFAQLSRR